MGTHRGRRSEFAIERQLVKKLAYHDRANGECMAQFCDGMRYFSEGEVIHTPRNNGSLDR